ncbi:TonB family protein [Candidatus Williamhamiltonella defendens]|uniref:TonB family protein n=1 Tax=Candidatus Williamhamiltonella defendens TaxID=138072 RepID=UPI00130E49A5|nr:TonB family protein [Candidatus Hamiltonella defensa]
MSNQNLQWPFLKAWPFLFSLGLHLFLIFMLLHFFIEIPPKNLAPSSLKVHMNYHSSSFLKPSFIKQHSQQFTTPANLIDYAELPSLPIKKNKYSPIKKTKKHPSKKFVPNKMPVIKNETSSDPDFLTQPIQKREVDVIESNYTASSSTIEVNTEPGSFKKVKPVYPARALAFRIEGKVKVQYDIDDQGRVKNIRLLESDPPHIFERNVKTAMKKWKFQANPFKDCVTVIIFKIDNN